MTSPNSSADASPGAASVSFGFDNSFARLGPDFSASTRPTPVANPRLIRINTALAAALGLDAAALATAQGISILSGNALAEGSEPLAQAYAGHQFGAFVPQLGDGRAILLGEVVAPDKRRFDVQLKGAGRTAFSRNGDGRAALGPVLREYLVSEAMFALGVPTTRALAAVATGEPVYRETVLPGAVLTRVASSHLRIGSFQYLAARVNLQGLRRLVQYAIQRHDPQCAQSATPVRAFLEGVIARQAHLVAQWMLLGFIHGVMNTDNMSISGETIDYGPCAFMDAYDPGTVFSYIDQNGRYAYGNQPRIAVWNLTRLAEALLPLLEEEAESEEAAVAAATQALNGFAEQFEAAHLRGFRNKLGLFHEAEEDVTLLEDLMRCMMAGGADFTLTFRRLCDAAENASNDAAVQKLFSNPAALDAWLLRWRKRLEAESVSAQERAQRMRQVNPIYIPRNHLVEAALKVAAERNDFQPFEELLERVTHPFVEQPGQERYTLPARPEERVKNTFCGT